MDYKVKAVLDAASACLWGFDAVVEYGDLRFFWVGEKLASEVCLKPDDLVGRYVGEVVFLDGEHVKSVFSSLIRGEASFPLSFLSQGGKVVDLIVKVDSFACDGKTYVAAKLM